ncbi:hypothetical protein OFC37_33135, partial [Escherichia coli]|nr:hypothetical protein [Escherichia coli]
TAVAFAVIAVGGFLLGAYLWFGGNVWVHQTFGWVALLIGTAMAACRWLVFPQCWPLHVALLAGSQFLFFVAVAAGQVFYFGPGSP